MAIGSITDVKQKWSSAELARQVRQAAGKGVLAAAVFYEARLKEILSVPAPRKTVVGKRGASRGLTYYRATSPATAGAPPRKLSGDLRRRQTHEAYEDGQRVRVGSNVVYAARHEQGRHPFLLPTLKAMQAQIATILGQNFKLPK